MANTYIFPPPPSFILSPLLDLVPVALTYLSVSRACTATQDTDFLHSLALSQGLCMYHFLGQKTFTHTQLWVGGCSPCTTSEMSSFTTLSTCFLSPQPHMTSPYFLRCSYRCLSYHFKKIRALPISPLKATSKRTGVFSHVEPMCSSKRLAWHLWSVLTIR